MADIGNWEKALNDLNVSYEWGKSIHNFLSGVQLPVFYLNKVTISLCIINVNAHGKKCDC